MEVSNLLCWRALQTQGWSVTFPLSGLMYLAVSPCVTSAEDEGCPERWEAWIKQRCCFSEWVLYIKCLSRAFETEKQHLWIISGLNFLSLALPKALKDKAEMSFNISVDSICYWLSNVTFQSTHWPFLFCFEILHEHVKVKHIQSGSPTWSSGSGGEALNLKCLSLLNFILSTSAARWPYC